MIENIALSKKPVLSTSEDIICEMIRLRDNGGYVVILADRLTSVIQNLNISRRVINAVYNGETLEECLYLIESSQPLPKKSQLNFVEEA